MSISNILFSSGELNKINFNMNLEDSKACINAKSKDITASRDLTATISAKYSDICKGEDLGSFSLITDMDSSLIDISTSISSNNFVPVDITKLLLNLVDFTYFDESLNILLIGKNSTPVNSTMDINVSNDFNELMESKSLESKCFESSEFEVLDCFDGFNVLDSFESLEFEVLDCFESSENFENYRNNLTFNIYNDESKVLANQFKLIDLGFTGVYLISFVDDTLSADNVDRSIFSLVVGAGNMDYTLTISGFNSNIVSFDFDQSLNVEFNLTQESTVNLDKYVLINEEVE